MFDAEDQIIFVRDCTGNTGWSNGLSLTLVIESYKTKPSQRVDRYATVTVHFDQNDSGALLVNESTVSIDTGDTEAKLLKMGYERYKRIDEDPTLRDLILYGGHRVGGLVTKVKVLLATVPWQKKLKSRLTYSINKAASLEKRADAYRTLIK